MNKKYFIEFLIRGSGFVFWYNLLNLIFNSSPNVNTIQHIIVMFICVIVGIISVKIKKRFVIEK